MLVFTLNPALPVIAVMPDCTHDGRNSDEGWGAPSLGLALGEEEEAPLNLFACRGGAQREFDSHGRPKQTPFFPFCPSYRVELRHERGAHRNEARLEKRVARLLQPPQRVLPGLNP